MRIPAVRWGGSSPRVRGTGIALQSGSISGRFIPACAGNRDNQRLEDTFQTVHPRVCGEQFLVVLPVFVVVGSSPRVRGTVHTEPTNIRIDRFIPACAGNSHYREDHDCARSVHPRVCGEQAIVIFTIVVVNGSSPRVRGTG